MESMMMPIMWTHWKPPQNTPKFFTHLCIFCSSALSSWYFASHQSKRGKNGKSLPPTLSLKLRVFFCYFFFRISVNFWSNKENTFVQQIGLSYKENDHIMNLTKYFLEKASMFLLERGSAMVLLIIWCKECSYQLQMRPLYWFLSFWRIWDIGFC